MSKIHTILLALACAVIWCGLAVASAHPKYRMRDLSPVKVDARNQALPTAHHGAVFGMGRHVGAASNPNALQMGTTYYDYQHNGSTGRQVDEFGGKVEVSWMKAPGPSVSIRTVNWNRAAVGGAVGSVNPGYLPLSGPLLPTGQEFSAVRPGYTTMRMRAGGKNITQYHDAPEQGGIQFWQIQLDLTAGNGIFAGTPSTSPNAPGADHLPDGVIWPKSTYSNCSGTHIHHGTGTWSGGAAEVWYWRGVINDGAGTVSWAAMPGGLPKLIDSAESFISEVVEANGSEVTIAMGKQVNSTNADVVYYRSTDCGVTWGPMVNVTNYSSSDEEGFYLELNAAYDPGGELHLIWNTAPANGSDAPVNLWHWSPTTGERLITSAGWTNTCVGGTITNIGGNNGAGANNLAIAEPSLSVKPAGTYGPDQLIYAVWVQYGPTDTDCATVDDQNTLGGHVNGEIYVSVSSNDGLTWDRPQNVTQTQTPDCDPGDCVSESWVSAAATADSGVYLSYVDDTHGGPAVLGGGAWSESPYMALAIQARSPVLAPVIAVSPIKFIELNANPGGGSNTANLNIISVGNSNLTYTVDVTNVGGGAAHLTVNGGASASNTITAGGAPHVITVGYDCLGLPNPSEHNWQLEVSSNDSQNNDPGEEILVDLQVFSAFPWFTCTTDTISTGSHKMQISACLEMGDQGTEGDGFGFADTAEYLYSGSPVITRVKSGDTVAYHSAFMGLDDRTRVQNKSFRALSAMTVTRNTLITIGDSTYLADRATGRATTTDTTIELNYDMIYPTPAHLSKGFVWKFKMRSLTGAPISNVHYGAVADIDVNPSAAENAGAGSDPKGYIAAVGGESDTAGNFTPNTKYMAIFHLPQSTSCDRSGARAAQVLSNPNYTYPLGAYSTDSLYKLFKDFGGLGSWGTNIHIDTGQNFDDVSLMMVTSNNATISNTDTTRWGYGVATSELGLSDLENTIEALRAATHAPCQISCLITVNGDENNSGTVTSADIITLVGYVFKGGAPPLPCVAAGDVNCSGTVTSADIITLVSYVFKGGAPPCDICANSAMAASCN